MFKGYIVLIDKSLEQKYNTWKPDSSPKKIITSVKRGHRKYFGLSVPVFGHEGNPRSLHRVNPASARQS